MTDPEDTIRKNKEFMEDAQQIIAKTNDLIAALNKLISKGAYTKEWDPKQLAQNSRLEEELKALLQRYFPASTGPSNELVSEASASASQNNAAVRPGRFRSRI